MNDAHRAGANRLQNKKNNKQPPSGSVNAGSPAEVGQGLPCGVGIERQLYKPSPSSIGRAALWNSESACRRTAVMEDVRTTPITFSEGSLATTGGDTRARKSTHLGSRKQVFHDPAWNRLTRFIHPKPLHPSARPMKTRNVLLFGVGRR